MASEPELAPVPGALAVSPHFSFAELSTTQHREFLQDQANPPAHVRANLTRLAIDLLEPARALVGPLHVSSGYRCPGLNWAIGGSHTSYHMLGLAADVVPVEMALPQAMDVLVDSGLPFDQLLFEFGRWLHLAAPRHGATPRGQCFAVFVPGVYELWKPDDPRIAVA